jgi:hypothetical protein
MNNIEKIMDEEAQCPLLHHKEFNQFLSSLEDLSLLQSRGTNNKIIGRRNFSERSSSSASVASAISFYPSSSSSTMRSCRLFKQAHRGSTAHEEKEVFF